MVDIDDEEGFEISGCRFGRNTGSAVLRCYFLADILSRSPRFIGSRIRRNEAASAVNTSRSNSKGLRLLDILAASSSTWQLRPTQKHSCVQIIRENCKTQLLARMLEPKFSAYSLESFQFL